MKDCLQALVKYGADINLQTKDKERDQTPLTLAIENRMPECALYLLSCSGTTNPTKYIPSA